MSIETLLFKGAINTSCEKPEVFSIKLSRHDPYGYNPECSIFNLIFSRDETHLMTLEFVNLHDLCYLRDIIYSAHQWCTNGVLMAISIAMKFSGFHEIKIIGSYLFGRISELKKNNNIFKEVIIVESSFKGGFCYLIKYIPSEITIVHKKEVFSLDGGNSLLDSALACGIELKHMCRAGICMKCRKKIVSGACVELIPQDGNPMLKETHLLTCNTLALTSLEIG